nr:hypothetical protein [Tanacetum cinerariifolium]
MMISESMVMPKWMISESSTLYDVETDDDFDEDDQCLMCKTIEDDIAKLMNLTFVLAEEGEAKAIAFDEIDKAFCRNYE